MDTIDGSCKTCKKVTPHMPDTKTSPPFCIMCGDYA